MLPRLVLVVCVLVTALFQSSHGFTSRQAFWTGTSQTALASSAIANGSSGGGSTSLDRDISTTAVQSEWASADGEVDWDWEKVAKDIFAVDKRPVILFDGVCNLCNGGVNFAIDFDETAKFRFCSLQSKAGQSLLLRLGKAPKDMSSIILVNEKEAYYSSDAVSRICMELDAPTLQVFGQLGQIVPPFVREGIYKIVSENRYHFGEVDSCRMDYDGTYVARFVQDPDEL